MVYVTILARPDLHVEVSTSEVWLVLWIWFHCRIGAHQIRYHEMYVWSGLLGLRYLVLGELVGTIFCGEFSVGGPSFLCSHLFRYPSFIIYMNYNGILIRYIIHGTRLYICAFMYCENKYSIFMTHLQTWFCIGWSQTSLYTRVLVNVIKQMKKTPI